MTGLFWKPLALLGGRNLQQLQGRAASECGKSIVVGVLFIVSMVIIAVGHWLFWQNLPATAGHAVAVAGTVAGVLGVMYLVALRCLDSMGGAARLCVTTLLGSIMVVNALLAGHELVIVAFAPQVQAQGRVLATSGIDHHATALEKSLGLPGLRQQLGQTDAAATAARAERARLPDALVQLQQQADACDGTARALQARIPSDIDAPGYQTARLAWRQQQVRCSTLRQQAAQELAQHQARLDKVLADLTATRSSQAEALQRATDEHRTTMNGDKVTLTTSATTGFARHHALWAAVDAGSVPAWAMLGLMMLVFLGDCFCFVIKLLVPDDAATADARQEADGQRLLDALHVAVMRRQRQLVREAVRAQDAELRSDLERLVADAVGPELVHGAGVQAFSRASRRQRQAHAAATAVGARAPAGDTAAVAAAAAATAAAPGAGPTPVHLLARLARIARVVGVGRHAPMQPAPGRA
ncbi:hypothetical protein KAK07_11845 [Ideonella sp. 4Y16]|uniref:hypothetical protein n=1 Tax=Ideonella alba TaxID=2824118 RepID=UPI001B394B21|nr:hypothetical protein [Ideonella alba]MBQ0944027.1 hypothetical protein [Ideonella alba]